MKKPNYIEIRLPGRKGTSNPAVKEYFKRLAAKVLLVNFAQSRERKLFEYSVKEARFFQSYNWIGNKVENSYWVLKLELKVPAL